MKGRQPPPRDAAASTRRELLRADYIAPLVKSSPKNTPSSDTASKISAGSLFVVIASALSSSFVPVLESPVNSRGKTQPRMITVRTCSTLRIVASLSYGVSTGGIFNVIVALFTGWLVI